MEKYKNTTETEDLTTYLTNVGCLDFAASLDKEDPMSRVENVNTLIEMTTHYQNLEEFYSEIQLCSGEANSQASKEGVKVLTIHSSKGLEFKNVFLPFWNQGSVPLAQFQDDDTHPASHLEEERRIAFVGLTRARRFIQVSYH